MDTHADDLAELVDHLDLRDAVMSGTRPAAARARYIARHGTKCVAKAVLICAVPPLMLKSAANPGGLPMDVFDQLRASVRADRSQFFKDLTLPFYRYNRPGAKVSEGVRESFRLQGMMCGNSHSRRSVMDRINTHEAIDHDRCRLFGAARLTSTAAELGIFGAAHAETKPAPLPVICWALRGVSLARNRVVPHRWQT
jgi:hypothetical protein